jgi:hypothetical protein
MFNSFSQYHYTSTQNTENECIICKIILIISFSFATNSKSDLQKIDDAL